MMLPMLSMLFSLTANAETPISQQDADAIEGWLYGANELTPYGRLQVAVEALEKNATPSSILALGSTHPHIAVMLTDPTSKMALDYILTTPSPERHKLRKGDGIIRKFDSMGKAEKKQALFVAKSLGLSKKLIAIRIGSFNGIDISMEISYKSKGSTERKTITLAQPFTPEFSQQARENIKKSLGTKPLPPIDGKYSLMPFSNPSFEQNLHQWERGVGFRFENDEPVGAMSLDSEKFMDGASALRFYNTEDTRVFPNLTQSVMVGDAYKVRFQTFVQSKNTLTEYRQEAAHTNVTLNYRMSDGTVLKTEVEEIRLGSYDWESVVIDSFVPEDAYTVDVVLSSSVSGTLWIDGCSLIRIE